LGTHAAGLREQVKDSVHGRLNPNPEDPEAVATVLHEMLQEAEKHSIWGRNARRRAADKYLVFTQVRRWLEVMAETFERTQSFSVDGTASDEATADA
jgi:trehalose synthase